MRIGPLVLAFAALAAAAVAVALVVSWRDIASPDAPAVSKGGEATLPARTKASPLPSPPSTSADVQTIPFPPASARPAKPETLEQAVATYRRSNPGIAAASAPAPARLGPDGQPLTLKEAFDLAQAAAQARAAASAAASPFAQGQR